MSEGVPSILSKQGAIYFVPAVAVFSVAGFVVEGAGLSPFAAMTVGFLLSIPIEWFRDWCLDWLAADQEVESVAP